MFATGESKVGQGRNGRISSFDFKRRNLDHPRLVRIDQDVKESAALVLERKSLPSPRSVRDNQGVVKVPVLSLKRRTLTVQRPLRDNQDADKIVMTVLACGMTLRPRPKTSFSFRMWWILFRSLQLFVWILLVACSTLGCRSLVLSFEYSYSICATFPGFICGEFCRTSGGVLRSQGTYKLGSRCGNAIMLLVEWELNGRSKMGKGGV